MNPQECPVLQKAGVSYTNASYGKRKNLAESNRIKELCLNCPYPKGCIYDEESKKRKRLENTLLDLMGRAFLTNRQVKKLQEVQRKLEEMDGQEQ